VVRLTLETAIPGLADAAAVFVLEQLLSGGDLAGYTVDRQVAARRLGTGTMHAGQVIPEAAFPAGEVIAFAADSPYALCMKQRTAVFSGQLDGTALERISPDARQVAARYRSFLTVPMTARGAAIGCLVLAREDGGPAFADHEVAAAVRLAAHAGITVASSLALMRQRSAVSALRPRRPAASLHALAGLEIAGRCLPATGYDIGGDWYDIISLPEGRTGLLVGDVMGHGTQAAGVMAQLSTAAYALADLDLQPAQVLRQLNRTTVALSQNMFATCAYAIIDPGSNECVIATAGHLPPVLVMPDGDTAVPELPGGQSLGISMASYRQARITLPPGTILALYTDGLVETRTRPFDQGILAMRSVLGRRHRHLDASCEELITSLGERHEDDITVVLARTLPRAA